MSYLIKKYYFHLFPVLISFTFYGQKIISERKNLGEKIINWQKPVTEKIGEDAGWSYLNFSGGQFETGSVIPFVFEKNIHEGVEYLPVVKFLNHTIVSDPKEIEILSESGHNLKDEFIISVDTLTLKKRHYIYCKINPLRKSNNNFEKLLSYSIEWKKQINSNKQMQTGIKTFATNSVLSNGSWFKISIPRDGIYKIDRGFLSTLGVDPDSIDPRNIRIYGNGGKTLPESNITPRPDDLIENSIYVNGEADGKFDAGDYALFYGEGTVAWLQQNSSCIKFRHKVNIYSDSSYYFINFDLGPGKRIQFQPSISGTPTHNVNTFDDYKFIENNSVNLIKSGREWYGDYFDILNSYTYNFNFNNIVIGDTVGLEVAIANRMGVTDPNAYSVIHPGGNTPLTTGIVWLNNYTAAYATDGSVCTNFIANNSTFSVSVVKNNSSAIGWINYLRVNARRHLISSPNQPLFFRDTRSLGSGNISKYSITAPSNYFLWDISNGQDVMSQQFTANGNLIEFTRPSDSLSEYVLFNPTSLPAPVFSKVIANQNLHAVNPVEYIIISHPNFFSEAQRLAEFHAQRDSLSYTIVTPEQCYNEFSSGSQDITAIREFVRMLYKKASTPNQNPKYLLLFGDGSYKYGNTLGNSNFIPTYQSPQSLQPTSSYTSDDFFGLLDDTEGDFTGDVVDIGVGRIPCHTLDEARGVVDKIINYCRIDQNISPDINSCVSNLGGPLGDWRNSICFVADDEDQSLHVIQADTLANRVSKDHPTYNLSKIYFDAYKQESTPGGQSYPDANREFKKQIERGCLIINYTGHGGELGLAHEGLVGVSDIQEYDNNNNLPLWFTATCEFSRYDDPDRRSAGEYVLLNAKGAGIALFSTVRLVYASSNFNLSQIMWDHLLDSVNNEIPTMGTVFMLGKQGSFADANTRNFTLLGDPALKLSYPKQVIFTDSINGKVINTTNDTLKALMKVTVTGHVSDAQGIKLNNFNGIIYPVVYDKANSITTLSNDAGSPAVTFKSQKNIIYRGKSSVKNGDFSFTFIVPKDISYNFGSGKISYYAHNGSVDATGYLNNVIVGGTADNPETDKSPPEIKLYLNDNRFVPGGTTNESPSIYAELFDSSGINTVGSGIGHDIVAILDENSNSPIILNDYYQADMDKFQSGKIIYGLSGLSEGSHKLSLKAWDVQNNSGTSFTDFIVAKSEELALTHVLNYPNPFSSRTQFFIEHNQCCSRINLSINIFTISGKVVKSIFKPLESSGFRSEGIEWDGKDEFGDKLAKGVYIYKVKISDENGKHAEQFQKLVILN